MPQPNTSQVEFHPVTPDRFPNMELLFEHHGYPGQCWCMEWRMTSTVFSKTSKAGRKDAMKGLVEEGTPVGILGYLNGEVAGWCSIAPRETYWRLERSKTLKRVDAQPVWTVICFYVGKIARGQRFTLQLLHAAVDYAVSQGATIIEGYPIEPRKAENGKQLGINGWYMGAISTFKMAGFHEAAVMPNGRVVMRLEKG